MGTFGLFKKRTETTIHLPAQKCPNCQSPMHITLKTPVLYALNLDRVVYTCEKCGEQVFHVIRRGST